MTEHQTLTSEERHDRLVVHLGRMLREGGEIEHSSAHRAIVRARRSASIIPNLVIFLVGLVLFVLLSGIAFLLASIVAIVGVWRKLADSASPRRLLVRVDELGRVSVVELEGA